MNNYLQLLKKLIKEGQVRDDRTGTGVRSLFAEKMEFDLQQGFPLLTTKKIYIKGVLAELLWFLSGSSNIDYLHRNNCHIWDEWALSDGEVGPIYGVQWRRWLDARGQSIDQIKQLLINLKHNPYSRRHLISAWNVAFLPDESISPHDNVLAGKMSLAPCHVLAQFYVDSNNLSCQVYLRSQDFFLGTPFNIASYAFLTHLIAHQLGYNAHRLIWIGADVHLYNNHLQQANLQLSRKTRSLPRLTINTKRSDIFSYELADFVISGYDPHPPIKAPISV